MFSFLPLTFSFPDERDFELAEFTTADLPSIVTIESKASPYPWSEKNFVDSLMSSHICVGIKQGSRWCAHAVFSIVVGEAELLILAVDPVHQGKGLAKKLLSAMEEQLKQHCTTMFLEVRCSNDTAIGLYEALGFNEVGIRENYYPSNTKGGRREDALIYAKQMNDEDIFGMKE